MLTYQQGFAKGSLSYYGGNYGDLNSNSIFPTDSGMKMILWVSSTFQIYSLPGTLPQGMKAPDGSNNASLSIPFPNPSSNSTRVEYKLPNGVRSGEVIFYNLNGSEVKRYKVDNTFDSLSLNNSDLTSGTYFYHLITPNGVSSPKKMVVIR